MSGAERIFFYLNFVAELVLLARLIQCRLHRTYRSLFLYWVFQAVATMALLPVRMGTYLYLYIYYGAQTIVILMAVFVVQDLYRVALSEHPAVASFGRRSVIWLLWRWPLSGIVGNQARFDHPCGAISAIHRFATFERMMNFVILIFLLLISGFLLWFPIKMRRNVVVYIFGFVLFCASRSFGVLLINLRPQDATRFISTVLLGLTLLCLLIWTVGIRPEGERMTATPGYRQNPETMRRLTSQLDAINAALARFVRS